MRDAKRSRHPPFGGQCHARGERQLWSNLPIDHDLANGGIRRILVIAGGSGEGLLTEYQPSLSLGGRNRSLCPI